MLHKNVHLAMYVYMYRCMSRITKGVSRHTIRLSSPDIGDSRKYMCTCTVQWPIKYKITQ